MACDLVVVENLGKSIWAIGDSGSGLHFAWVCPLFGSIVFPLLVLIVTPNGVFRGAETKKKHLEGVNLEPFFFCVFLFNFIFIFIFISFFFFSFVFSFGCFFQCILNFSQGKKISRD